MRKASEVQPVDDISEEYMEMSRSCWNARDGRCGGWGSGCRSGTRCGFRSELGAFGAKVPTLTRKGVILSGRGCAEPASTADSGGSGAAYEDHAPATLPVSPAVIGVPEGDHTATWPAERASPRDRETARARCGAGRYTLQWAGKDRAQGTAGTARTG